MHSRRSSTSQFCPPPPLVRFPRLLNSGGCAGNTKPRSRFYCSVPSLINYACTSLNVVYNVILNPGRISEESYVEAIKEEISKVVKLQEELDIDVLVHGEPEVSSQFYS